MPTVADIQAARKAGNLTEALQMAEALQGDYPQDLGLLRQMAWIHYGFIKNASEKGDRQAFYQHLDAIIELGLDLRQEGLLGNQIAWRVYALAKDWGDQHAAEAGHLLDKMKSFTFDRDQDPVPSVLLLRLALKVKQRYPGLLDFMAWWDLANLPAKEYEKYVPQSGRPIMSLAEQAHNAYAKALLDLHRLSPEAALARIEGYLPQLTQLIEEQPQYEYPPYQRAKLLIAIGKPEQALMDMQQFVLRHDRVYWPWAALGTIYHELERAKEACICIGMALTLEQNEVYLIRLRPQFAELLLESGNKAAAKRELLLALDTLAANNYKVPYRVSQHQQADWFKQTEASANNQSLYKELAGKAKGLLYGHLPQEAGIITQIDAEKKRVHVLVSRVKRGFFRTQKPAQWEPGQTVAVRLETCQGTQGPYFKVVTCESTNMVPSASIYQPYAGIIYRAPNRDFGFVGEGQDRIFIPAHLMRLVTEGQNVAGVAIAKFDKKKERWGWQAVTARTI